MKKQPKTRLKTSQHIDIHIHAQERNPAVQTSPRHTSAVRSQSDNRPATILIRSVAREHTLMWRAGRQAGRADPASRPPCHDRAGSIAGDCPRPWQRWSGWRRAGAAGRQEGLRRRQRNHCPRHVANQVTSGQNSRTYPLPVGRILSKVVQPAHRVNTILCSRPAPTQNPLPPGAEGGRGPGRRRRPAGSEIVAQRLTVTLVASLFTYLKNTGKATKKATQIRYSIPLMCE